MRCMHILSQINILWMWSSYVSVVSTLILNLKHCTHAPEWTDTAGYEENCTHHYGNWDSVSCQVNVKTLLEGF
jgi:hypothetical protein